jgi:hypothetical protein
MKTKDCDNCRHSYVGNRNRARGVFCQRARDIEEGWSALCFNRRHPWDGARNGKPGCGPEGKFFETRSERVK